MNINVENLRVVVTAGGQGIGRSIAETFLANGACVHICDIDAARLTDCLTSNPNMGGTVADVANPNEVKTFIANAVAQMGGIDILINNAGIAGPAGPVETLDWDGWKRTLDVNLGGQFLCAKAVIPYLKAQRSGAIINIATTAALYGFPNRAAYASSKWAVVGLMKTLAMELGEFNIRANVICPGSVNNERMEHVIQLEMDASNRAEDEVREQFYKQVSMHTFIDPDEIASMSLFLASPLARHVSGQVLSIDGNTETMRA